MKVIVIGGTHVGIVGLYGKKCFEVNSLDELPKKVADNLELEYHKFDSYTSNGIEFFVFENEKGETLFEYHIEVL